MSQCSGTNQTTRKLLSADRERRHDRLCELGHGLQYISRKSQGCCDLPRFRALLHRNVSAEKACTCIRIAPTKENAGSRITEPVMYEALEGSALCVHEWHSPGVL